MTADNPPPCAWPHCWHYTGEYQYPNPPNWQRICCRCGRGEWSPTRDHGPMFARHYERVLPNHPAPRIV